MAAVAAALVAIPAISAARTASAAAIGPCTSSGLVTWINTNGNGTAGSVIYQLRFTNLSGRSCSLRGFPGVSAVNLNGKQLGRAAGRDTSAPKRTIVIRNGHTAKALLLIVDVVNFPRSKCKPVTAAGLRVFAPNQTAAKIVPFPFSACSRGAGPTYMSIRTVTH
jgi:hypothetical protein